MACRRRSAVEESLAELRAAEVVSVLRVERAQARLDEATRGLEWFGPLPAGLATRRMPSRGYVTTWGCAAHEEAVPLKPRTAVKEYQHRLAQLDADHSGAQDRLAAARRKRAEVVAEQDRLVTAAKRDVNSAITALASEVGLT